MAKTILVILIILVVIWAIFLRGGEPADVSMSDDNTQISDALPTADLPVDSPKETSSSESGDSAPSPDSTGVLLNAQTFTNRFEPYTLNFHEYWAWRRYNDVGDDIVSVVAFDPKSLSGRDFTDAAITVTTYSQPTHSGIGDSAKVIKDENSDRAVVFDYNFSSDNQYLDIFNAMVESFRFLD